MTTFQRQRTGGSFVAYEANPTRTPMPIQVGDREEKAHLHPEVFVHEYPHIKVKSISPSEKGSGLAVEFDPASVPVPEGKQPLRRPINVNTVGGDIEKALRWALDNDEPLYLAVEYRRKYKNFSGEVIPYDTPIMQLRGCDDKGNPTPASQGASRENISKVLAVIGPVSDPTRNLISDEVRSNPMTWPALRSNRIGATPPLEWVRITRPDGTAGGAAIPKSVWTELTGASGGTVLDDAALARIADAVATRLGATSDDPTMTRPPKRTGRSAEGKRWESFNSDGRVNPGSYAVTALLSLRDAALTALGDANYAEAAAADGENRDPELLTAEQISVAATALMGALSRAADGIQSAITNKPANRIDGSYITASKALRQVMLREVPLTVQILADAASKTAWLSTVTELARALTTAVMEETEQYLDVVAEPTPINDASGRAQRQVARQNEQTDPRPTTVPANRDVQAPPEPDFSVDDSATGPVSSVTDRNKAILTPILGLSDGLTPAALMPLLGQVFGTADLEQIDPDRLAVVATAWKEDVDEFLTAARTAYKNQNAARTA